MNKKKIILFSVLLILFVIIMLFPYKTDSVKTYNHVNKNPIDKLDDNDYLEQVFEADDNYNYVGLFYANYGRLIKKGYIKLSILNEQGKIKKYKIKVQTLFDNSPFYVKYKVKKGKKYRIVIENKTKKDITFYTTDDKIKNAEFYRNGELQSNNLILSFKKKSVSHKLIWYYFMFITIFMMFYILSEKKVKK